MESQTTKALPSANLYHFRQYSPDSANMDLALCLCGDLLDDKYEEIRQLAPGNPAMDSSITPRDGSCPWKLLPRELRDEILIYAYGRPTGGLKILFKSEIELYNKRNEFIWMDSSSNRSRVSIEYMGTPAQQSWKYGELRAKLTRLTSPSVSSITSTDSSSVNSGRPKLPRPCSPPPRSASKVPSRENSFHTPA